MKKLIFLILSVSVSIAQAFELKTESIGTINLNGALTGYSIYTDNKVGNDRKTRYDVGSALISISKSAEPVGFTVIGGAYSLPVVGAGLSNTSNYTKLYSALPIAYIELAPLKGFSIQVGKLPTLIGYESAFTYLNNYIQRGLVWDMQPVIHNGVRLTYSADLFSVKLGVNDGFYTLSTNHPKPAFELSLALTPVKDGSISFNVLLPDKSSRPNDTSSPANKRVFNLVASYTLDKITLGTDLTYVEAPKDDTAQVLEKAKASGVGFHAYYDLKPFKVSGRVEYVKDNTDAGNIDLVGLGDSNKAWTFTLTPAYAKGPLFIRSDISYVSADKPFTNKGKKNQNRLGVEVGFIF